MKTDTPRNSQWNLDFTVHNRLSYSLYRWPCLELKVKRKQSPTPSHFTGLGGGDEEEKNNKQASRRGREHGHIHTIPSVSPDCFVLVPSLEKFHLHSNFFKHQMEDARARSLQDDQYLHPQPDQQDPPSAHSALLPRAKTNLPWNQSPGFSTNLHGKKPICSKKPMKADSEAALNNILTEYF